MKKLFAITLFSLVATGSVAAGNKKTDETQTARLSTFGLVDVDKDGYITPAEAKNLKGLSEVFKKIDTDGDQRISKQEFAKFELRKH